MGGELILTIGGGGSDGLRETVASLIEFCFEYCLKFPAIDIAAEVFFFW